MNSSKRMRNNRRKTSKKQHTGGAAPLGVKMKRVVMPLMKTTSRLAYNTLKSIGQVAPLGKYIFKKYTKNIDNISSIPVVGIPLSMLISVYGMPALGAITAAGASVLLVSRIIPRMPSNNGYSYYGTSANELRFLLTHENVSFQDYLEDLHQEGLVTLVPREDNPNKYKYAPIESNEKTMEQIKKEYEEKIGKPEVYKLNAGAKIYVKNYLSSKIFGKEGKELKYAVGITHPITYDQITIPIELELTEDGKRKKDDEGRYFITQSDADKNLLLVKNEENPKEENPKEEPLVPIVFNEASDEPQTVEGHASIIPENTEKTGGSNKKTRRIRKKH